MGSDCLHADPERKGDLCIRVTIAQQREHLRLACRELESGAGRPRKGAGGEIGCEPHAPGGEVHRTEHISALCRGIEAGAGSECERLCAFGCRGLMGEQHQLRSGVAASQLAHLAESWQGAGIDYCDIRSMTRQDDGEASLLYAGGNGLDAGITAQQFAQSSL